MIITLTLNPSLDRTLQLESLVRGGVLRTAEPTLEPGGKGVNVSRALVANGAASVAILPVGGGEGADLSRLLAEAGVDARFVPVSGRTRSNITIAESDGTVTKLNEPGSPLDDADLASLLEQLAATVSVGDWVVVSGSVPPGFTTTQLAELAERITAMGASLAVDSSGEALAAAAAAQPRLIKPNRAELSELVARPVTSIADVIAAAEEVRALGIEYVLVSLGADGAVLVCERATLVGTSHVEHPRSTVGAGDSFLAGFLLAFSGNEADLESAFLDALAWGAAATALPGSAVPASADIDLSRVQLVWRPDLDRPLVAS